MVEENFVMVVFCTWKAFGKATKQAGTELGQAQLKLGLDCTVIFCRFGFSPFGLIELV